MPLTLTHNSYSTEDARRHLHLKAVFMRSGPYEVKNFVPATGIGKFDLRFDPKTNRIDVTVNFAYRFSHDPKQAEQIAWDSGEETRFRLAAKPLIESMWSDVYTLTSCPATTTWVPRRQLHRPIFLMCVGRELRPVPTCSGGTAGGHDGRSGEEADGRDSEGGDGGGRRFESRARAQGGREVRAAR